MIKWCIFLHHQSSTAYETLHQSGVLHLPSQHTLRDYSNCVKATTDFSTETDEQIMKAANYSSYPAWHKLVFLLLDEVHIREYLVYIKHTGKLVVREFERSEQSPCEV